MKATIYHNTACGTSRKTLAILQETPEISLTVIEYLKTPPSRDELARLYARAGMTPRAGLRTHNSPAEELCAEFNLLDPATTDDAILDAMTAHPALIERPLVETDKGVRLCRPSQKVLEILEGGAP
ncbi:MAG: arsenate reductase (glutaredoxin) [Alphaproteobacteria bacterium]|nr:arsenate reductase (glutaredoxin) [Alphaproteobacteria bacterium]MDE2043035.1 arsenate reductase (glutaredoxin) [Alphaproteobacteria bacterium]MDE2340481.1 arsenate reductase (glutaredoxin) [Alphaproteobacteria bacterium]